MKLFTLSVIGSAVALATTMFTSLTNVSGYYMPDAHGKSVWVEVREESCVYVGNGTFETSDSNLWCIDIAPDSDHDGEYDLEGSYTIVLDDNGTANYIYDDNIIGVYEY